MVATVAAAAVAMRGIDKRYGAVQANRGVQLTVAAGTVHGVVGENGAGKSTLMAILYGLVRADRGEILIAGQTARIGSPRDAMALGIGMVHQHFMLAETLSAIDNVLLGAEPGWRLQPARAEVRQRLHDLMRETGLAVELDSKVADLPVGSRQRLEILKALLRGARILILDEPTAVLTPQETGQLFATLRRLRGQGTTILLVTHRLREIFALCDTVTVMRGGQVVLDGEVAATNLDALAEAMVGRRVQLGRQAQPTHRPAPGAVLLQARGLVAAGAAGAAGAEGPRRLDDVSLALRAGEIVGVAGVAGNGQSELLDALAGLLAPVRGELEVGGASFAPGRWIDPRRARELGIAHVPEDRQRRALVLPFAAWESAVLGHHGRPRYRRGGWLNVLNALNLLDARAMRQDCTALMEHYDIRPPDPALCSGRFSGGNQQKLVLAREAAAEPRVLLAGQPTRGVDIGAVEFIHHQLRALRDGGSAVLLVSSDLDEILALSDRVLVMNGGRIVGELAIDSCTEGALGRLLGGAGASSGATA